MATGTIVNGPKCPQCASTSLSVLEDKFTEIIKRCNDCQHSYTVRPRIWRMSRSLLKSGGGPTGFMRLPERSSLM